MELYYKEERDRDLFRAYNEALKSLGKMAVNVPREQIVRRVVYSIAPRFYISYEEARRNVKRIFKGYSPRCVSSTRTEMYNDLANMLASYLRRRPQVPFNDALCTILAGKTSSSFLFVRAVGSVDNLPYAKRRCIVKRFPYILCIVFPVFVWACHTSRQTIGEARENRVHSIDRDLHVVIDSLCRNEWSGLTEWEWTHVDVFDSVRDETVNPSISITRLKQSKKVVARNETAVSDSLNETAALQSRSEKEQNHRSSKEMDTHRVSGCVLMIFIVILFFYIIRRK